MLKTIDRAKSTPLHVQLRELFEKQVLDGKLEPESLFPSERELCRRYNVSQITVRQAIRSLEQRGALVCIPRKGTYVAKKLPEQKLNSSVGMFLPENQGMIESPFVAQLIAGVKSILQKKGVLLVLLSENENFTHQASDPKPLDGIIVTDPHSSDMRLREFQKKRIPVVVVGRPSAPNIHYVDSDNVGIGRLMTRHLFEAGFRKPAFVGFSKEQTLTKDRLAGYKTEVRNHGLQVHRNLISIHDRSENVEKDYTESLLKNGADSLVCEDDLMALRTIKSIHVLGLSVSKDIGIVGCNNSSFVHYSNPPISSVEIFPDKIGACAAEKLLCIMEGAECDIQTIVPHKLYVRTSSQGETQ